VTSSGQFQELNSPLPIAATEPAQWYAIHTRARHERAVEQRLRAQGMTTFLPVTSEVHRWSDRRKRIEVPVFSCYLFIYSALSPQDCLRVSRDDSVFGFVGVRGQGIPIPDEQIDAVRRLIEQDIPWSFHPFLKVGQRVRIHGGALDGIEGIFLSRSGHDQLILSVDAVQRSLAVRISGYDIEVL
jgi:transcription termination/antitermination protein NusG